MRYSALLICAAAFWTLTPYAIMAVAGRRKVRGVLLVALAAMLFALCLHISRDIGIQSTCV
jgi:hypothetical protein